MSEKKASLSKKTISIISSIVMFVILVSTFFLNKFPTFQNLSTTDTIFLVGTSLMITLFAIFCMWLIYHEKNIHHEEKLSEWINAQNNAQQEVIERYNCILAKHADWFYSHDRLATMEKQYCGSDLEEIWIATTSLDYESSDSGLPFIKAIEDNLKEGISYVYFIPKEDMVTLSIKQQTLSKMAENLNKENCGTITFIPMDDRSLFTFLSYIVIYKKPSGEANAFKELLIAQDISERGWLKFFTAGDTDFNILNSKLTDAYNSYKEATSPAHQQ